MLGPNNSFFLERGEQREEESELLLHFLGGNVEVGCEKKNFSSLSVGSIISSIRGALAAAATVAAAAAAAKG